MKFSMLKVAAIGSAAALSIVLSGCGALSSSSNSAFSTGTGLETMSGKAMGGLQPISGATIQLYAMGTTGYGSFGTLYATTTTNATGAWSFTRDTIDAPPNTNHGNSGSIYSCASGTEQQMYVIASGGNTTGNGSTSSPNNPAAHMIAVLGACHNLGAGTRVILNEVVTVGSIVALQQFFNPTTETFGRPSSSNGTIDATYQAGLTNAINIAGNLVDIPRGHAIQNIVPGSSVPGVTMSGIPEYQKLNTMANILAACVNSSYSGAGNSTPSSSCSLLFANAIPPASFAVTSQPSFTFTGSPTDIAQAAYFMAINPSASQSPANFINLYSLQTSTSPFSGTSTQPTDWTVAIFYYPSGTCPASTASATTPYMLDNPYGLSIDATGNVWVANGTATAGLAALSQFSPTGGAMTCVNNGNNTGRFTTIDTAGNVWMTHKTGAIRYTPSTGSTLNFTLLTNSNYAGVGGIAAAGNGDVYIAPDSYTSTSSTTTYFGVYPGGATASVATASSQYGSTAIALLNSTTTISYRYIATNAAGYAFFSGLSGQSIYRTVPSATPSSSTITKLVLGATPGPQAVSTAYGLAPDLQGNFVGGNTCCAFAGRTYRLDQSNGSVLNGAAGVAVKYAGGSTGNRGIAVDGAGNIWTAPAYRVDNTQSTTYSVFETDYNFNGLSPNGTTPSTCDTTYAPTAATPTYGCATNGGFQKPSIVNSVAAPGITGLGWQVGIDPSGNVWNASAVGTTAANVGQITGTNLYVLVGAAVPRITPLVADLH